MIDLAIGHVVDQLNAYFNLRSQVPDRVVAGSLYDLNGKENSKTRDKVVLAIVNVEEERVYRSVELFEKRADGTSEKVKPPIRVNLFILVVANLAAYDEAMKSLGLVMSFFQHRRTFDYNAIPDLTDQEGRMSFELHNMSFEQLNHLWGAVGGKYMPSVVYKVGFVRIRDRQVEAEVLPVEEIQITPRRAAS